MVMLKGLGALALFMDAEEGAAFITDNERFITCSTDLSSTRLYTTGYKDPSCKFQLSLLPSGKVYLRDMQGLYMSVFPPNDLGGMEPTCPAEEALCEFAPYYEGDHVALKGPNGMFLRCVFRSQFYITASGITPDECCRFRLVIGDELLPVFDIREVEFGRIAEINCEPRVLMSDEYHNPTNKPVEMAFTFAWDHEIVETTSWCRAWGMDNKSTYKFALLGIQGTLSYDGTYQKVAERKHTIQVVRTTRVTIPPYRRVKANLVGTIQDDVELPFEATIRKRRADGSTVMSIECGKWKGMVYDTINLEITQEPRKDDWPCRGM